MGIATAAPTAATTQAGEQPILPAAPTQTAPARAAPVPQPTAKPPVKVPEHILKHVNQMTFHVPPHMAATGADVAKVMNNLRTQYAKALMAMETARTRNQQIDNLIKERNEKGNPLSAEEAKSYQLVKDQQQRAYDDGRKFVEGLRRQQEALNKANLEKKAQAAAASGQAPTPTQAPVQPQAPPQIQAQPQHLGQPQVQPATQTPVPTPAVVQKIAPSPHLQTPQAIPTPVTAAAAEAAKAQAAQLGTPTQQQVRPSAPAKPTLAAQQQAVAAVKTEQVHPSPVNTQVAAATGQHPSASTPTARVQTPQAGTPVSASARPLSMSAAVNLANQRVAQPGTTPTVGQPTANGTPVTSAAGISPASAVHTHAHPVSVQTTAAASSFPAKMPIPKQLPDKLTQPVQPVTVSGGAGHGRPTYTGGTGTAGGAISQPALPKVPAYVFESEGEHVLSKKKLNELVRQVCGGSAEGQEENLLAPEVEEVCASK